MNKVNKGLLTLLCSTVLLTIPSISYASPMTSDLEIQIDLFEENIANTEDEVKKLVNEQELALLEKQQLSGGIADLTVEMQQYQEDIDILQSEVDALKKEIDTKNSDIAEESEKLTDAENSLKLIEKELAKRKEMVENRLRTVQVKGDSPNILDIVLSSKDIGEVFHNIVTLNKLQEANNQLVESVTELGEEQKNLISEIEVIYGTLVTQKSELDQKNKDLKDKKELLNTKKLFVETKMLSYQETLEGNEEKFSELDKELEKQQEYIDALNSDLTNTIEELSTVIYEEEEQEQARLNSERIARLQQLQNQLVTYSSTNVLNYTLSSDATENQQALIEETEKYLGVPYVWGGTTPNGFDCSGLVQYVYKKALGINIPRTTKQQQHIGVEVSLSDIQVGDLIFWGDPVYHVAIYAGNGYYIHAPTTGDVVKYANRPLTTATHIRRVL